MIYTHAKNYIPRVKFYIPTLQNFTYPLQIFASPRVKFRNTIDIITRGHKMTTRYKKDNKRQREIKSMPMLKRTAFSCVFQTHVDFIIFSLFNC